MSNIHETDFERVENDKYYTEPWLTEAVVMELLNRVGWGANLWEPSAGGCHMVETFNENGFNVTATDLDCCDFPDNWRDISDTSPKDFFTTKTDNIKDIDLIAFNPPFGKLAYLFVQRALQHMMENDRIQVVAALCRSDFKHASTRDDIWSKCPYYAHEVVVQGRPRWDAWWTGIKLKNGPKHNYSWYIWDKRHTGPTITSFAKKPKGIRYD